MTLLFCTGVEGMANEVMEEVGRSIMCWLVKCQQGRKGLLYGSHPPGHNRQYNSLFLTIFLLTSYVHVSSN